MPHLQIPLVSPFRSAGALTALLAVTASSTAAVNPVGTWIGHAHFLVPTKLDPRKKGMFGHFVDNLNKQVVTYRFAKNHTYSSQATARGGMQHDSGTWSVAGKSVLIKDSRGNKKFSMVSSQVMTLELPSFQGIHGTLTLKKS